MSGTAAVFVTLGRTVKDEVSMLHQRLRELLEKSSELARNESDLLKKLDGAAGEQKRSLLKSKEFRIKMHISLSTLIKRVEKFFRFANLDEEGLKEVESDSSLFVAYFKQLKQYLDQIDQLYEECITLCTTAKDHCSSVRETTPNKSQKKKTAGYGVIGFLGGAATAMFFGVPLPISLAAGTGGAAVSALVHASLSSAEIKNKQEELFAEFLETLSSMDFCRSKLKHFFECILTNKMDENTLRDLEKEDYENLTVSETEKSEQEVVRLTDEGLTVLQVLEDFVKDFETFQQDLKARREAVDNEVHP